MQNKSKKITTKTNNPYILNLNQNWCVRMREERLHRLEERLEYWCLDCGWWESYLVKKDVEDLYIKIFLANHFISANAEVKRQSIKTIELVRHKKYWQKYWQKFGRKCGWLCLKIDHTTRTCLIFSRLASLTVEWRDNRREGDHITVHRQVFAFPIHNISPENKKKGQKSLEYRNFLDKNKMLFFSTLNYKEKSMLSKDK